MTDLQLVATRLKDYYLTVEYFGDGAFVLPCTVGAAGDYLASQQSDGSWADVDYACTESAANGVAWSPYLALDRMQAMAVAYQKPAHPLYRDPALLAGVERALAHWAAAKPRSVNWWENDIGIQLRFGRIGLFVGDELSDGARDLLLGTLQTNGDGGTGQNSLWFTQNSLFRALTLHDAEKFAAIAAQLDGKMAVQTGAESREALQVDGSFHGHGELFMSHHYGMALFRDMSLWGYVLRDTAFALSPDTVATLAHYLLDGTRWTIRGEIMETALGYLPCAPEGYARQYYAIPIRRMQALDPAHHDAYQTLLDNIEGRRPDNGLNGFHYMWTSAYASHMRPTYGVNLRMDSHVIKGAEWRAHWEGEGPGNLVFWTNAATLAVTVSGEEYRRVYPTFDWRHTPGTTAPFALASAQFHDISRDRAVGVTDGDVGATGFVYQKCDGTSTTGGTLGTFFFDGAVVRLGAGVSSDSPHPVHTTLNQTRAVSPQTATGTPAIGTDGAELTGNWVHNDRVGYIFFAPTRFHASALDQSQKALPTLWHGNYAQFSFDNVLLDGTFTTDDTFSLWLDHGVQPHDVSFAYLLLPDATAAQTKAAADHPPVTVLCNTPALQAVRENESGLTQAVFYEAGALKLDGATLAVDEPCAVLWRPHMRQLTVAVENDAATDTLTLTLGDTTRTVTLAAAPYHGQSVTVEM